MKTFILICALFSVAYGYPLVNDESIEPRNLLLQKLKDIEESFKDKKLLSLDYYRENVDLPVLLKNDKAAVEEQLAENSSKEGIVNCRNIYDDGVSKLENHLETFYVKSVQSRIKSLSFNLSSFKEKLQADNLTNDKFEEIEREVKIFIEIANNIPSFVVSLLTPSLVRMQFEKIVGKPTVECINKLKL